MAINSFTLNNLYNNGILDYVPYELCSTSPISNMQPLQNPYSNLVAEEKGNFQSYNNDTFSKNNNSYNQNLNFSQNNQGVMTSGMYGGDSFFNNSLYSGSMEQNNNGLFSTTNPSYQTIPGLGLVGQNGDNGLGLIKDFQGNNINTLNNPPQSMMNLNTNLTNHMKNATSFINQTPNFVKGLISGTLLLGTLLFCLKRGKKAPTQTQKSFWSKLNPMNLLKK